MTGRLAIFDFFLSSLFPKKCLICGSHLNSGQKTSNISRDLCRSCGRDFISLPPDEICSCCGDPLAGSAGGVCGSCIESPNRFSVARSVFVFSGAAAASARNLKYRADFLAAELLSSLTLRLFPPGIGDFDMIVPVPLYPSRLRAREFNQSAVVSSKISAALKKQHAPFVLKRVRDTAPQASISERRHRKNNVRGAFSAAASEREKIKGKKVMIFDDIFTTGATVDECSAALLRAGAKEVKALTIFRTPI